MSNKYVLFSPIGMTDPCRKQEDGTMRDGAMLHIVRHYHPEVVRLFLTHETMDLHNKDGRYCKAIESVYTDIETRILPEEPEKAIKDANKFEIFDEPFRNELVKLHKEYQNHEILVNVSSGTPQMEASLYALSVTLPFNVTLIQVDSPAGKSNREDGREDDFEVEKALKELAEGEPPADGKPPIDGRKGRTVVVHPKNLTKSILKRNIKALLENYDYQAAYSILEQAPELFSNKTFDLCYAADHRLRLDTKGAYERAYTSGRADLFSLHGHEKLEEIYEYILTLDILLKRNSYADYARAISPAITAVMEQVADRCLRDYSLYDLCTPRKKDQRAVMKLEGEKIKAKDAALWQCINDSYTDGFRDCPLSGDNLLKILRYCKETVGTLEKDDYKVFSKLLEFEGKVRNKAAHTITSISEDDILKLIPKEKHCNERPKSNFFQEKLHDQFKKLYGQEQEKNDELWKDYINMNNAIIQELDR